MHVGEDARAGAALRLLADRLKDRVAQLRAGGGGEAERRPEPDQPEKDMKRPAPVPALAAVRRSLNAWRYIERLIDQLAEPAR